jgi:nitrous oxide reductase accessory protein NosL
MGKDIGNDTFGNRIQFADDDRVQQYPKELHKILLYLAEVVGTTLDPEAWVARVFVSDLSNVGDFSATTEDLDFLEGKLGFPVVHGTYLYEITEKLAKTSIN